MFGLQSIKRRSVPEKQKGMARRPSHQSGAFDLVAVVSHKGSNPAALSAPTMMPAVVPTTKAATITVALRIALGLVASLRLRLRASERHDQGGCHRGGLQEGFH